MDAGTEDTQAKTMGVVRLYEVEGTRRVASDLHSG